MKWGIAGFFGGVWGEVGKETGEGGIVLTPPMGARRNEKNEKLGTENH